MSKWQLLHQFVHLVRTEQKRADMIRGCSIEINLAVLSPKEFKMVCFHKQVCQNSSNYYNRIALYEEMTGFFFLNLDYYSEKIKL